ncbi:MAG TPA: serine/threonine-protein kinase [Candidatus Bilamarchaeum sp.]|nr:serine/threonine-protein kinase [Candidatus Bilamarchaeum sp.]
MSEKKVPDGRNARPSGPTLEKAGAPDVQGELDRFHVPPTVVIKDPFIGKTLADRYEIKEKIGQGGMGLVYLAEDTNIARKQVALKILPASFAGAPDVAARFINDAKVATLIGHDNVINVTDLGVTRDGVPFFVMEHLKGSDLGAIIGYEGAIQWDRAKGIVLQICAALKAAHEKGIYHRDMKPDNVFLIEHAGSSDFVKVLDFGIAKLQDEATGGSDLGNRPRTRQGMVMGTPQYMSPEQGEGKEVDHRTDVYAVGIIMYEMLCGMVPFSDANPMKTLEMHRSMEPILPSVRRPDLSIRPEIEAIAMKAIEKNPDNRYQSIAELEGAIRALDNVIPLLITAGPPTSEKLPDKSTRPPKRAMAAYVEMKRSAESRRLRRAVAAGVIAALVAGAAIAAARKPIAEHIFHLDAGAEQGRDGGGN